MRTQTFTVVPFLVALWIGVAPMGLQIYDVHAWEVGTVHVPPGRSTGPAITPATPADWLARLIMDERGEASVDLLTAGLAKGRKALIQQQADLRAAALENLNAAAEGWQDRADQFEQKLEEVKQARERVERLDAYEITPDPAPAGVAELPGNGTQAVAVVDRAKDDPKRGFATHREFMRAVLTFARTGRMDDRLKPLHYKAAAGSDEHGGYSDPHGGFLLPVAFSPDLLSVQAEGDPTADLTRKLPMEAPMVKVNARTDKDHSNSVSGGLRVYRHAETTALTSSRMETEQIGFEAHELIGLGYATESQISDSPMSFIALIADGFRDEFAAKILQEKIRGTGAGGQYLGVLNSDALITIGKETQQKADTIVVENIDKMAARCWRYNSERTVYLANQTTRPQLRALVRNIGTGGQVVNYFTNENGQERLDGRLIFFTEFASALGDLGDLLLVHWPEYIEGLYQPMQTAESIHVRFENHERAFKFWVRNAGQPWWRSALTPKFGDTLSPLVTLAAR